MTEARADASPSAARLHAVHVTAVVVTCGPTQYLPRTLAGLAGQTRPPDVVLLVDARAEALGGAVTHLDGLLPDLWPAGAAVPPLVVDAPGARTLGDAVRSALTSVQAERTAPEGRTSWLWLLHDDSSPEPTALAELLRAVEVAPSVAVAGCKQHTWTDPVRLLEVGVSTSRFGRRMTGMDGPEVDQGQHDAREDVLGVGTAGALVRRDVWDALRGTDPALGPYGDGLDLSRRARLAGHRVVVVPAAVVRHAQATLARPAGGAVVSRPGWDARRSARATREAFVHAQLAGLPAPLVPVVAVLAVVSGLVRALGRLMTKEPHLLGAELVAPLAVLARPGRVIRARRTARATRVLPRRTLRPLQTRWTEVAGQVRDRRLAAAERRRTRTAPSELELSELAALRRRRRGTLAVVVLAAVALTAVVLGSLVSHVLAGARLSGGSLAFGDAGPGELWRAATAWWVSTGFGAPGTADPLLVVLAPLTALVGTAGRAVAVLLLGAFVLAAVGAWFAAGAATRSLGLRAWAALVWTAAPALLVALQQARLGGVVAHAALPWVVLGVARGVGVARIDVVLSGLVGAKRIVVPDADAHGAEEPEEAEEVLVASSVEAPAEPSLAAAAGAALAFAVLTAAAPVLLPAGVLVLLVVAMVARRRGRLLWTAVPALVLQGPLIAQAVTTWPQGGWRLLVAEPLPAASAAAAPWQQALGWPVPAPTWSVLPEPLAGAAPFVVVGVVALVAVLALFVRPPAVRAARVGWVMVAAGLAAAALAVRVEVAVVQDPDAGTVLATAWPGPGLSLALAGLLLAALVGAARVRPTLGRHSFGWRQAAVGLVTLVAVLGPGATLAVWSAQARDGSLALTASADPVVPAVGQQMQVSPDDVRVLTLEVDATGETHAALVRHDGVQLTERSRAVEAHGVRGGFGAPRLAEPDAADTELADIAARLDVGMPTDVAPTLGGLGVGAVLVPPGPADGTPDAAARVGLVGRLDATPGLERVTETQAGVIWRVAGTSSGSATAWARLVGGSPDGDARLLAPVPADDGEVDTDLPAGSGTRFLVLAERADPGWRAWLDGRPLRAVETSWRQAFEVGPEGGRLVVEHAPAARTAWLVLQGVVVLATVLLAVPVRRRRGGTR